MKKEITYIPKFEELHKFKEWQNELKEDVSLHDVVNDYLHIGIRHKVDFRYYKYLEKIDTTFIMGQTHIWISKGKDYTQHRVICFEKNITSIEDSIKYYKRKLKIAKEVLKNTKEMEI